MPQSGHEVQISAVRKDPIMCPVKLLLVPALRSNNSHGSTIEEVLSHAGNRVDRRIIWRNPDLPVFCTMPNSREYLVVCQGPKDIGRPFPCLNDGCEARFRNKHKLQSHVPLNTSINQGDAECATTQLCLHRRWECEDTRIKCTPPTAYHGSAHCLLTDARQGIGYLPVLPICGRT